VTLSALIRKGGLAKAATAIPAISATQHGKAAATVARIATVAVAKPTSPKGEPLPDPAMEARRQRVLAMLAERPDIKYAVVVDNPDTDPVIVALAIRDVGTCELVIPAANYDAFALLALIERHGATVH
jgi:hypothetical protein